jgi:hypothetical protein
MDAINSVNITASLPDRDRMRGTLITMLVALGRAPEFRRAPVNTFEFLD